MGLSTANGNAGITGTWNATFDGVNTPFNISFKSAKELAAGTAVNQGDLAWWDTARSLAATTEELDLAGGLPDPEGNAITFARIKKLYIKNNNTTEGETLKIGGAAANAFLLFDDPTDIYELGPDGIFFVDEPSAAALPVTAGTGDLLKLDAGAATVSFDICIIGASA